MSKSISCHRLAIRELIEQLDEEGCVDVIQSLYHQIELGNLHDWLSKMIFSLPDTTAESLNQIENTIANVIAIADASTDSDTSNTGSDCYCKINANTEHHFNPIIN